MAQALYRKWRPQTFDDIVGQEHIVQTLRQALRTGHMHHAYLLAGPRGVGKTTTARLIAKAVNCLSDEHQRPCGECEICQAVTQARLMDLIEIDAASNTGVDNIRELLEKVGFRPTLARFKVYVIDEVHMLSTAAFNALLKTLEEPPEHVIFVLATTEVHRIPETILSRCQRFEFRRIPLAQLVKRLQTIADEEGVTVEPEALDLIARAATGSMRDAISLFDQMASIGDVTGDYVRSMLGAEKRTVIRNLLQAWIDEDLNKGLQEINRAVDGGADPRQLARQTADFMRGLLLIRIGAGDSWQDPTDEERHIFEQMARGIEPSRLAEAIRLFSEVASQRRTGWQPQLPLELAFVQATMQPAAVDSTTTEKVAQPPASRLSRPSHPVSKLVDSSPAIVSAPVVTKSPQRQTTKAQPEPTQKAASQPPSAPVSTGPLDAEFVSRVQAGWANIVKQVQPRSLGARLGTAQVEGADEQGRLVLGFEKEFHRAKFDEADAHQRAEKSLSQVLRKQISFRGVMRGTWHPSVVKQAASPVAVSSMPESKEAELPPEPEAPPDEPGNVTASNNDDAELARLAQEKLGAEVRIIDEQP